MSEKSQDWASQAQIREVYRELDEAIAKAYDRLVELEGISTPQEGMTIIDWVLCAGMQKFDEDGDRESGMVALVHGGDQPYYITEGLLSYGSTVVLDNMTAHEIGDN